MFVGRRMTRNVVTVTKDTNILKVKNILKQHHIDQVPVVEENNLVGIISDADIRKNTASPANTLSVHELNYLLSEMKAEQIMTRELFTATPGTTIEEAAIIINQKKINSLPVVVGKELVGIITTCDLLNVLLEFMGMGIPSSRVELSLSGKAGEIAKIANMVNNHGMTIVSIVSNINSDGSRTVIIRVDADDIRELCKAFEAEGYKATYEYKVQK